MLQNVPSADELEGNALRLYYQSWYQIMKIIDDLLGNHQFGVEVSNRKLVAVRHQFTELTAEESQSDLVEFINKAQPDLQLCYTLVQQSQELGLKAIICRESPFLLLLGADIRSLSDNRDFTDLRTIDASDLVRVVNAITPRPLSAKFSSTFNTLRKGRNKIAHLGHFKEDIDPLAILDILIEQYIELYPERKWLQDMLDVQSMHQYSVFVYDDYDARTAVLWQLSSLERASSNNQLIRLLKIGKGARRFRCQECSNDVEFDADTACTFVLDKGSLFGECLLCERISNITYKKCPNCGECDAFFDLGGPDDLCCYCGFSWGDGQKKLEDGPSGRPFLDRRRDSAKIG